MYAGIHVSMHICRGQRTIWGTVILRNTVHHHHHAHHTSLSVFSSFILRISPPTVTFFSVSITYAGNKRQDLVGVYLTSWARVIGWPSEGFSHLYSPRAWVSSVCHHSRHLYMGSKGCIQVFQLARQALHWAPVSRLLLSTMFFAVAYLTFYFGSTEEWTSLMLSSFFAFVIFYDSRFWPLDTPSIGIYPPCSITGSISQTLRN